MLIRAARPGDETAIWAIIEPILRAGETYTLPRDWTREQALEYWFAPPHEVFVAEEDVQVLGTCFLTPNQEGGGAHVANCGFMTAAEANGRGVASAMCQHSLDTARKQGFYAMQFNFVVSTNERAIALWQRFGFQVLTRLPGAFQHPTHGRVDALLMYQIL